LALPVGQFLLNATNRARSGLRAAKRAPDGRASQARKRHAFELRDELPALPAPQSSRERALGAKGLRRRRRLGGIAPGFAVGPKSDQTLGRTVVVDKATARSWVGSCGVLAIDARRALGATHSLGPRRKRTLVIAAGPRS
jgi:hypothetical protein